MGDDGIQVDTALLLSRLTALYKHVAKTPQLYGDAQCVQLVHGKRSDVQADEPFVVTLQMWLFGYEFPDTIAVLAGQTLYIHASEKKLGYLRAAEAESASGPVSIKLLVREKGDNNTPANAASIKSIIDAVQAAGGKIAVFPTDPMVGPVAEGWDASVKAAGIERVDGSRGVEGYWAVKDAASLVDIRKAGVLTARCLKYCGILDMEAVIDEGKKMTNADLSAQISSYLEDKAALEKKKVPLDTDNFDAALQPVVQSGGEYDIHVMKPGAASSTRPLSYDVIILSMAMRYKGMRAACARTVLIDPTPKMQKMYDVIYGAHRYLIDLMKPGAVIKDVVVAARDKVLAMPDMPMSAKMVKNFGSGVGARINDRYLVLNPKNENVLEAGMVFTVQMGLSDIPRDDTHKVASAPVNKIQNYAVLLADAVLITENGPVILTDKAAADRKQVSYEMAGDDDEEEEEDGDEDGEEEEEDDAAKQRRRDEKMARRLAESQALTTATAGRDATGRSARLREKAKEVDPDAAKKREDHQVDLIAKKRDKAARGEAGEAGEDADANELDNAPEISAYRSTSDFPKGTTPNRIIVDKSRDSVLVPMLGTLVPFHISTIKNVNKTEEGHKAFFRINFYAPGQALGKDAAPSIQAVVTKKPELVYVRTLNFMSRDHKNFIDVDQKVKAMLKNYRAQRKEEKESAGLVEQARLIVRKDGGSVPRMLDINMWPALSGRKSQGTLSAHVNGMQFISAKGERLDIIYSNIKSAIFQPCEGEHVVLLHFHLKHPILIGKKKFRDVQFFTEVIEASHDIDKMKRSDYDPDELNEEEKERQLRVKLNKAFKSFVQRIEDAAALDHASTFRSFEVPTRDLSFHGAWAKEMTTVLLGSSAIVAVVDKPPLVVPVDDMELVHFERVTHGGKSFDMVIVYKAGVIEKGTADEFVRISSIEMKHLETIKTWLDEVAEVVFTESVEALLWKPIIQEQVRDPFFWRDVDESGNAKNIGMYDILNPLEDEGGEDEDEEESEAYSEEDDDDDDDEYDEDEDLESLVDEDDESDFEEEDDDDDDGDDWDEMDRKAEEEDRQRSKKRNRDDSDDEDDKRKSKKKGRK